MGSLNIVNNNVHNANFMYGLYFSETSLDYTSNLIAHYYSQNEQPQLSNLEKGLEASLRSGSVSMDLFPDNNLPRHYREWISDSPGRGMKQCPQVDGGELVGLSSKRQHGAVK